MIKTKNKSLILTIGTMLAVLFAIIGGVLMFGTKTTQTGAPTVVKADASGNCGDNATWEYDSATHTLSIHGTGAMANYESSVNYATPNRPEYYDLRSEITTVNIGTGQDDAITMISNCAFEDFYNLVNLNIGETVETICYRAFANCGSLVNIVIPDSVTEIRYDAFFGPSYSNMLTNLTLGDGITLDNVAYDAFVYRRFNSVSLGSQIVSDNENYKLYSNGRLTIKKNNIDSINFGSIPDYVISIDFADNVTELGDKNTSLTFDSLHSVTISNNITSIGSARFGASKLLETVVLGTNVETIGESAFAGCVSLSSINLPNGLTSISYRLFMGCTSLTAIEIPESVQSIGNEAFAGCVNLSAITISNPETTFGAGAFFATDVDIENLIITTEFTLSDLQSGSEEQIISNFISGIRESVYPDENAPMPERNNFEYILDDESYVYNGINNTALGYRPVDVRFDESLDEVVATVLQTLNEPAITLNGSSGSAPVVPVSGNTWVFDDEVVGGSIGALFNFTSNGQQFYAFDFIDGIISYYKTNPMENGFNPETDILVVYENDEWVDEAYKTMVITSEENASYMKDNGSGGSAPATREEFYVLLATIATRQADSVSGNTWVFANDEDFAEADQIVALSFTSKGITFAGLDAYEGQVRYIPNMDNYDNEDASTYVLAYDSENGGWQDNAYKTIIISENATVMAGGDDVTDSFFEWLGDVAEVQQTQDVPSTGIAVDIILPTAIIVLTLAATVVVWKKKEQY